MSPETAKARLLIAPSTSPISIAFAVPMACAAQPIATPLAMGWRMRRSFSIPPATRFPKIPVRMMEAIVSVEIPPNSKETSSPIAVVMDLGSRVTYCSCVSPKIKESRYTLSMLDSMPQSVPKRIAFQFFFNSSNWRYSGIARHMVAGVSK